MIKEQLTWLLIGVNKRYGVKRAETKVAALFGEAVMKRWWTLSSGPTSSEPTTYTESTASTSTTGPKNHAVVRVARHNE